MPLDDFERRAVIAVCEHLSATQGGTWRVERVIEDEIRTEPVPEALLSNGTSTVAVEVKALWSAGGQTFGITESLDRRLRPSCGGQYVLDLGWHTGSLAPGHIRHLRKEIERLAPCMAEGETCALPIPRQAKVIFREAQWRRAWCNHNGPYDLFDPLRDGLPGSVSLIDHGSPEHNFVTDGARERFLETIRLTAEDIAAGRLPSGVFMSWYEEAELTCATREVGSDDGVTVLNALVGNAVRLDEHADAEVRKAIVASVPKFRRRNRWADRHLVVLGGDLMTRPADVAASLAQVAREYDMSAIDEVLLFEDGRLVQAWRGASRGL